MASNDLQLAFNEIAEMRSLPQELIIEALQSALVSAYRKFSGASSAQAIRARIEPSTGRVSIFVEKEVVEEVLTPSTEVTLEKARYYEPECNLGDMVMVKEEGTAKSFGRIAAQTAKQVILQKIREAERTTLFNEFIGREGDLVTATVQSFSSNMVTLSLGRAEAVLPRQQQIPNERYRPHERLRVYVMEVKSSSKGPQIICSRSHRNMLSRLLEYEVPEIYNGQVVIKNIAREAGHRSKVAVMALQDGIDPVGACVGQKGVRIQNIVKELSNERIDVVEWSEDAVQFITNALKPAQVVGVYLENSVLEGRTAVVVVQDEHLSQAIGAEGQNARLAAKLTGWRIDIKSLSETVQYAIENLHTAPLSRLAKTHEKLVDDTRRIYEKLRNKRIVTPEEYTILSEFAKLAEQTLLEERNSARRAQRDKIEAVKLTVPTPLFKMPVDALGLNDVITEALQPLGSIGDVMVAMLVDEDSLERLIKQEGLDALNSALDAVMLLDLSELDEAPEPPVDVAPVEVVVETPKPVKEAVAEPEGEEDELKDAFGGKIVTPAPVVATPEPTPTADPEFTEEEVDAYVYEFATEETEEDDDDLSLDKKVKKKDKKKNRRQLVYDEDSGEVRPKRQRKTRGGKDSWDFDEF